MKKTVSLILAAILLLGCLTACGGKKTDNKLVIATSPDFPPFEYLDDGQVVGIEIDILNAIAAKLGKELEIQQMDFDSVLPGVQAKKFQVGVSGISVTEDRKKNVLFTDPYCLAAQAIVVLDGSEVTCKADLDGKKISVQTGTTAESFCLGEGYNVSSFTANSDAEAALTTGKVDAWVIDDLTAKEMVDAYNASAATKLVALGEAMTTEPYAFALAFGSEALVADMNKALAELAADGSIAAAFEKFDAPFTAPQN